MRSSKEEDEDNSLTDIAVVGLSCRFPGALNIEDYWNNLVHGNETISHFSKEELINSLISNELLENPNYVKARGILKDIDKFDADFFGFNPRDARITDPQHKLLMECVWQALETAGYVPEKTKGIIGLYASMADSSYLINNLCKNAEILQNIDWLQMRIATSMMSLATQISYRLNLTGPSININTACSSALVSIATACQALIDYQCDIAIAGAVAIYTPEKTGYLYQEGGIESPDGHCRSYDSGANGTVFSNGAGVTVLKRMSDAIQDGDYIYGVIKGWNVNNDGADKVGYTAPSIDGQVKCIISALAFANITPDSLQFIEGHGTGTTLGDAIELTAFAKAFALQTKNKQFCAIGSVKPNIGHTDVAAGMASFIKAVLALKNKTIPPTLNYQTPNSKIDLQNGPFYVNSERLDWPRGVEPRRAGVNSLGIGGTNAFLVLEEFDQPKKERSTREHQLLLLSAKTKTALEKQSQNLIQNLEKIHSPNEFADIAYTLQVGRADFKYRKAILCNSVQDALTKLMDTAINLNHTTHTLYRQHDEAISPKVVFMFSGQGTHYLGMGKVLYETESAFSELVDLCCQSMDSALKEDVYALIQGNLLEADKIQDTRIVQPALFVLEYALAKFWMHYGVQPEALIGHSLGEYSAAAISGVITLKDAIKLITFRARLMATTAPGGMLQVEQTIEEVQPLLNQTSVSIAAINTAQQCVLSGSLEEIIHLEQKFQTKGIPTQRLKVNYAFHSKLMDPILEEYKVALEKIEFKAPTLPLISNLTGDWVAPEEITTVEYWLKHLRHTVKFSQGLQILAKQGYQTFIEIGPGKTLVNFVKEMVTTFPELTPELCIQNTLPVAKEAGRDQEIFLRTVAQLWLQGVKIVWDNFYKNEERNRVPLPMYPFDYKSYWIAPNRFKAGVGGGVGVIENLESREEDVSVQSVNNHESVGLNASKAQVLPLTSWQDSPYNNPLEKEILKIWQNILGIDTITNSDDFYELGGHSFALLRVLASIEKKFNIKTNFKSFQKLRTPKEFLKELMELGVGVTELSIRKVEESCLVNIRSAGRYTPLFCFHPIDGTTLCYMPLEKHLTVDCPIYGLQDLGLEKATLPYNSLEEIASDYIKAMQRVQKQGPYTLCGFSFGGVLAVEIARQLGNKGEQLNPLILFDAWAKLPVSYREEATLKKVLSEQIPFLKAEPHLLELCWKRINLFFNYRMSEVHQKIILFKAKKLSSFLSIDNHFNNDFNYWNAYASSGMDVHLINGSHETFLQEPHVRAIAEKLKLILVDFQKEEMSRYA